MKSQIIYSHALPRPGLFPDETVLFYDSILAKNMDFKNWTRAFRYKIALKSGENLKTIDSLKSVFNKISKMDVAKSTELTFIGAGGGQCRRFRRVCCQRVSARTKTGFDSVDVAGGG